MTHAKRLNNLLKTLSLALLFTTAQVQASAPTSAKNRILSVDEVRADIALAKEAYERIHPGYTRYASIDNMNVAWENIIRRAERNNGLSLGDFYLDIQQTLTLIRCDHTKANLPKVLSSERDSQPLYLPFLWEWVDGRGIITFAPKGSELNRYDEIIEVDGRLLSDWVEKTSAYIPVDGYTEWSKRLGVSDSLEFQGGAVDHFGALLWDIPSAASIVVKSASGNMHKVQADRVNYTQYKMMREGHSTAANFKDAVYFERIGEKAAYLRIDSFVNYRQPVKPETLYDPIFKVLRDEARTHLILDLRNNGGGSDDASNELLANLISQPRQSKTDIRVKTLDLDGLREHLWTWDKRALNPNKIAFKKNDDGTYSFKKLFSDDMKVIKPTKYSFKGKIIVLTSDANSSGSTNVMVNLKDGGRAIFVGEKTGGSAEGPTAGLLFTLTLPESKITTRIPFFAQKNNVREFEHGLGLSPDIYAPMTAKAFVENKDPAFEAAVALINTNSSK